MFLYFCRPTSVLMSTWSSSASTHISWVWAWPSPKRVVRAAKFLPVASSFTVLSSMRPRYRDGNGNETRQVLRFEPLAHPSHAGEPSFGHLSAERRRGLRPSQRMERLGGRQEGLVLGVGQLQVRRGGIGLGLGHRRSTGDDDHIGPPNDPSQRH